MRFQIVYLVAGVSLLLFTSCDHLPYDITMSAEGLAEIKQGFDDNQEDYIVLHDMLIEDEITWLELYDSYWRINDYSRSTPEGEWYYLTEEPYAYEEMPDALARVGITEERLLHYKKLVDILAVYLATQEGDDVVFYIKSFESRGKDYLVEIIRTQVELAGTVVSSIDDMTLDADEDYYLPLGDGWYLHYRNYLPGRGVYPRPRHPNGAEPLSY